MKNEILAQALTNIDDALIAEANERGARGSKITARTLMRGIYRYGAVAACLVLAIGVLIAGNLGGQDVLLYGESIADSPRTVAEYMPRAVAYYVEDTVRVEDISLPLELQFKKETTLTLGEGMMLVLDESGDTLYEGTEYAANGSVSLILTIPGNTDSCVIKTNRGYNIVLTRNSESGIWYVNIEK